MSDFTPAQHAQLGCEYLDELLHDLETHDWCQWFTCASRFLKRLSHTAIGIAGKVNEHAKALGWRCRLKLHLKEAVMDMNSG